MLAPQTAFSPPDLMKRFVYQLHSWVGIVVGLGLLLIGLTGSVIVFKNEIDQVIAPHLVKNEDPAKPRLGADQMLAEFRKHLPGYEASGWGLNHTQGQADTLYAVKHGETEGKLVFVDSSTGKPRAEPLEWTGTVTNWIVSLHYTFMAGHVGEAIAGVFGAMLCLLGITGVWIYRGFWKTLFLLRWGRSTRIFFSDLHKMVGITSTAFNLLLGFTGAWWNLSHIIGHALEEEHEEETPAAVTAPGWNQDLSIASLMQQAEKELPGYTANWISLPSNADTVEPTITFFGSVEGQSVLRSKYGSMAYFDPKTGALTKVEDIRKAGLWEQIKDSFRPLHYGDFGGLPVKILWSLGGMCPAILAISGSIMWWKRKKPKKKPAKTVGTRPQTPSAAVAS